MQRLIYQGKLHCSDVAGFSIGPPGDRKFRRREHRCHATSIRVNAKSRSTPGGRTGVADKETRRVKSLSFEYEWNSTAGRLFTVPKNPAPALCQPDIIHEFSCAILPVYAEPFISVCYNGSYSQLISLTRRIQASLDVLFAKISRGIWNFPRRENFSGMILYASSVAFGEFCLFLGKKRSLNF